VSDDSTFDVDKTMRYAHGASEYRIKSLGKRRYEVTCVGAPDDVIERAIASVVTTTPAPASTPAAPAAPAPAKVQVGVTNKALTHGKNNVPAGAPVYRNKNGGLYARYTTPEGRDNCRTIKAADATLSAPAPAPAAPAAPAPESPDLVSVVLTLAQQVQTLTAWMQESQGNAA
jgi:hypothetical protein